MLHRYTYIIMCLAAVGLMLVGCDHIAEEERLIYDPIMPETGQGEGQGDEESGLTKRVVLLEDFTGQRCPNCPTAGKVVEQLQEVYGDALVAVAIHGGQLAVANTPRVIGLKTDAGEEYNSHWKLAEWPMGMIDRHGLVNYPNWVDEVKKEWATLAPLRLEGTAAFVDDAIAITVKAEGTDGTVTGKLQIWLLEDGIKALQLTLEGVDQGYIHNHVLRTAVNGTWGEDFSIGEGEIVERTFTQTLEPNWNKDNLSIVAFVYNDDGVQQVTKFIVGD